MIRNRAPTVPTGHTSTRGRLSPQQTHHYTNVVGTSCKPALPVLPALALAQYLGLQSKLAGSRLKFERDWSQLSLTLIHCKIIGYIQPELPPESPNQGTEHLSQV